MILVVLTLLIVGGRRVWHVAYVANDPVVRRVTGLRRIRVDDRLLMWAANDHYFWLACCHQYLACASLSVKWAER